jgi:hypothetical protein
VRHAVAHALSAADFVLALIIAVVDVMQHGGRSADGDEM